MKTPSRSLEVFIDRRSQVLMPALYALLLTPLVALWAFPYNQPSIETFHRGDRASQIVKGYQELK